MTEPAKPKGGMAARTAAQLLTPRESEALRIARELAREAREMPNKAPVRPDRANRYVAG